MPFDLSSAAPVDSGGFDLSSAQPADAPKRATTAAKPAAEPESHGIAANAAGAVLEPIAAMGSGMLAKPISDIAGLAATGKEMISPTPGGGDPAGFARHVRESLTYEPRTAAGKAVSEYNPLALLGKGVGAVAHKAGEIAAPPETSGPGRAGFGRALEEGINQLPGILGAKGGAKIAEGLPAKQAALDVAKGENLPRDTVRDKAQASGYIIPPEHGIKAAASGAAGKVKAEKIASEHNEALATRKLGAEVGVPEGSALTAEEFDRLKEDTGRFYDEIPKALGPTVTATTEFSQGLRSALDGLNSLTDQEGLGGPKRVIQSFLKKIEPAKAAPPSKGGPPIMGTIAKTAQEQPSLPIAQTLERAASDAPHHFGIQESPNMPVPTPSRSTLSTKQVMADIQQLRKQAKADFAAKNSEIGTTRLGIAHQLEDLIEKNLSSTGQQGLIEAYRAARERFAKIYLLERITNDSTGRVNLQKLASLSDSKAYKGVLTGEFKDAADLAKAYRKGTQRSTGEAPQRLTVLDGLFATYGLAGAVMGHPMALLPAAAEIGGRLAIPAMAGRGMLQNRTPSYQVGGMRRGLPLGLPVGGAAVTSQTEP